MYKASSEREDARIARVEAALRTACEKARAAGHVLVTGDFQVELRSRDGGQLVVGCCAWGALGLMVTSGAVDDLEGAELSDAEYDAIENGWDDQWERWIRGERIAPWFALGARLAAEFSPVPAGSLRAA